MEKNIYFNILKIFVNKNIINIIIHNIIGEVLCLLIDNKQIEIEVDGILNIEIKEKKIIVLKNNIEKEYNVNIKYLEKKGFGGCTNIETPTGKKKIENINAGDYVLDKHGSSLLVKNVYIFSIDNNSTNKPILIDRSKCGLNLPCSIVIMSMKSSLKIKKVTLKGRSLYLNGKAKLYEFDNLFKYYALETENNNEYLLSGFVTDSV